MALIYYPHQEIRLQDLEIATRIGELFHNKTSMRYYMGDDFHQYGSQLLDTWIFAHNASTLVTRFSVPTDFIKQLISLFVLLCTYV